MRFKTQFGIYDDEAVTEDDFRRSDGWSAHGDGEPRWIGPAHLDPDMARRRAVLCGRVPPPRKAEDAQAEVDRLGDELARNHAALKAIKPEKVYHCKCGKALDPMESGVLCGGCL